MSSLGHPPVSATRPDLLPLVDQPGSGVPPWLRAWAWSAAAMVLSAAGVGLVGLLASPRSSDPWAELGWFLLVLAAVVVVGVVAGAVTFGVRLARTGDPHPVVTGLLVVPIALALGAASAGTAALLAPPIAFWLVSGFSRRRAGPAGVGPHHGLAQRIVVGLLVCGLATTWIIAELGYRFGGAG